MIRSVLNTLNYYKVNIIFPSFFGYLVYCDWSYTQKFKERQKAKQQADELARA